jgi:5'-phosphate synthase pdxT subunit
VAKRVGILAIQGDVAAHAAALARVGADAVTVRRAKDLDGLDALILPGGESTTISKGLDRLALYEPIEAFARAGRRCSARARARSCSRARSRTTRAQPRSARRRRVRNAYGTQVDSFAAPAEAGRVGGHALRVHPRAAAAPPRRDVEVLARHDGWPIAVRQGNVWATTFHPELTDDRVHEALLGAPRTAVGDRRHHGGHRRGVVLPVRPPTSGPPGAPLSARHRARPPRRRPGGILREYEFTFVVQPEISDEGVQAISQRFEGILASHSRRSSSTKTGAAGASPTRSRTSRRATTRSCTSSPMARWCPSSSAPRGSTTRSCAS